MSVPTSISRSFTEGDPVHTIASQALAWPYPPSRLKLGVFYSSSFLVGYRWVWVRLTLKYNTSSTTLLDATKGGFKTIWKGTLRSQVVWFRRQEPRHLGSCWRVWIRRPHQRFTAHLRKSFEKLRLALRNIQEKKRQNSSANWPVG